MRGPRSRWRSAALCGVLGLVALLALSGCRDSSGGDASSGSPASPKAGPTSSTPSGKASSDASATKLPPPCSLISASEASASLGYTVTSIDSSADNDPDQISCLYVKGSHPAVVLLERRWSLAHFTKDAAHEPGSPRVVPSLGTSAYLGSNEKGPVVLVWERGVAILVNGSLTVDQAKFLAKVAVGQLDSPS